jgi:imidazole glycerol phosphate synthase glutamine amidotransferase subunit
VGGKTLIGIINYGAGNLGSVVNALRRLELDARFAESPAELDPASSPFDKLIFPGDGHFAQTMKMLDEAGYSEKIKAWIAADKPFLGICIGMQVLFESSDEAPGVKGLSLIKGRVKKFPCRKTPQIGWNETESKKDAALFRGIDERSFFYYIHSYYCQPEEEALQAAQTEYYGTRYCSAVERGSLLAVQFHPEKSGETGLSLLRNWGMGFGV